MQDKNPTQTTEADNIGFVSRVITRDSAKQRASMEDSIADERPIAMLYNDVSFAVMMATPADLEDFALGFSLTEGLIGDATQLTAITRRDYLEGIQLAMTVAADAPASNLSGQSARLLPGRGSCGICGTRELESAIRQPNPLATRRTYTAQAMSDAFRQLSSRQPMNAATGATHAAAWATADGHILLVREDVGRHNALDKLIGAMARAAIHPDDGMLILTSRASYEMVTKAAQAGISFVAAISAPTALAVELARSTGVCLVGFARPGSHNIYTFPERLLRD